MSRWRGLREWWCKFRHGRHDMVECYGDLRAVEPGGPRYYHEIYWRCKRCNALSLKGCAPWFARSMRARYHGAMRLGCGCPRIYAASLGHTCCIHDERGRRWTDYTAVEVAHLERREILYADDDESTWCHCEAHEGEPLAEGEAFIADGPPGEEDALCLEGNRLKWLGVMTTDWTKMAEETCGQNVRD